MKYHWNDFIFRSAIKMKAMTIYMEIGDLGQVIPNAMKLEKNSGDIDFATIQYQVQMEIIV